MEIQGYNSSIKWKQLTAKEILQLKDEGKEVPSEFQKWAAAMSAVMNVKDDVTYEMANGETDIAALDETLGMNGELSGNINPVADIENNIGNEDNENEDNQLIFEQDEKAKTNAEKEDPTLADVKITTDPNEILKRKLKRGEPTSS